MNAPALSAEAQRRSLRAADRDAACSAFMTGATEPFMTPYALALGASPFEIGLLSSARNALLAVVQLASAEAVRRAGSRRALVLWTAGFQALTWTALAWVKPLFGDHAVAGLIALYTAGTAAAALGGPAWGSLVADYTPPDQRGHYFGRRARLSGLAATAGGMVAGAVLQTFAAARLLGFRILCLFGFASRAASWQALFQFHDAGWKDEPHLHFSFVAFLRRAPHANFARFSLCLAANSLAANVAAPFFAVYLLEEAGYSYVTYTAVMLAGSLAGTLSSPAWGRIGDRFGNHAVLRLCMAAVIVLPLLWMVSPHPIWMLPLNIVGAVMWGGLNLCATNFLYDAVSPGKRHTCIAYFNVVNGIGVSAGALAGSIIADARGGSGAALFTAFQVSAVLRLVSWIAFDRLVREVRPVRQVGLREVMLDFVGQQLVAVLGYFSVEPDREFGRRLRKRAKRKK